MQESKEGVWYQDSNQHCQDSEQIPAAVELGATEEVAVQLLLSMGFRRNAAEAALAQTANDVERAAALLVDAGPQSPQMLHSPVYASGSEQKECMGPKYEAHSGSGLSETPIEGSFTLSYALTLTPAEEHVQRKLQQRIMEELHMDLESVRVRQVQCGTVSFDVHVVPRNRSENSSRPGQAQEQHLALKKVLETTAFPLVPTEVSLSCLSNTSSLAHNTVSISAFPRSQSTESFFTPPRNRTRARDTSPQGVLVQS